MSSDPTSQSLEEAIPLNQTSNEENKGDKQDKETQTLEGGLESLNETVHDEEKGDNQDVQIEMLTLDEDQGI